MSVSITTAVAAAIGALSLLAACTEVPGPTPAAPAIEVWCLGEPDGPTIVLENGLGYGADDWDVFPLQLSASHRVCTSSRAGVGNSAALAVHADPPSPGSAAEQLHQALAAIGERPPYVVLGFSYGGMVAQAFTAAYPGDVTGLVLDDSADPDEFTNRAWRRAALDWNEGGRRIDQGAATRQLADLELGDLPLFVLTQDQLPRDLERLWRGYHDRLAAMATSSVHVLAQDSGHAVHEDRADLVLAAVDEVWTAAVEGTALAPCDGRFATLGGRCL